MVVKEKDFCLFEKMKTWQGVEEFVAIVEAGSMTGAARALGVSVASVSRQLEALEDRLGVNLLKRSTRRHSLTGAGERFYDQARIMTGEMQALADELRGLERELSGPIRISSAGGYVVEYLSPLLARFAADHPRVSIELDVSTRVIDMLTESIDLAIRHGRMADTSLVARKLFERQLVMAASADYLKAHGRPRKPADLRRHQCLLGFGDRWPLVHDGRVREVKVKGRWRSNNGVALLEAARAGLGILYQPITLLRDAIDDGVLVPVMRSHCLSDIPVWAVYPSRRHLPARVRLLVEFLEAHAPWASAERD